MGKWAASTGVPFVVVHCPLFLPLGTSQKQTRLDTTQSQKQPHLDMTVATQSPEHDRRACFVLFHPANISIGKVPSPALLLSGFLTGSDGTRVVPISCNWAGLHVPGSLMNTPMVPVIGDGKQQKHIHVQSTVSGTIPLENKDAKAKQNSGTPPRPSH